MNEMEMPQIIPQSWSVRKLYTMYKNKEYKQIDFDIPTQRGIAWENSRRSLYIHSVLLGLHVFQSAIIVNAVKDEEGRTVYQVYDGKQRVLSTLMKYIDNEYCLIGLKNEPAVHMDDGKSIPLNGLNFEDLPTDLSLKIMDATMNVAVAQNASDEVMALIFRRINNAKPMSKFDISRSNKSDMSDIIELAQHPIFKIMYSEKGLESLKQHEIIVKTYISMYEDEPNFSGIHINAIMKTLSITPEQQDEMKKAYDIVYEAGKDIYDSDIMVGKLMLNKTHFLAYIRYIKMFPSIQVFEKWIKHFFGNMPREYIEAKEGHTTSAATIKKRYEIVQNDIKEFLK